MAVNNTASELLNHAGSVHERLFKSSTLQTGQGWVMAAPGLALLPFTLKVRRWGGGTHKASPSTLL